MSEIEIVDPKPAPDFELVDSHGRRVKLTDYKGKKIIVLVFNRGFT